MFDIICRDMDCGKLPGAVYLDLSKTFDTIGAVYLDLSKTFDTIGCSVLMNNDFLLTSSFQRR